MDVIETIIDQKKLMFLCKLLTLSDCHFSHTIINIRLKSYYDRIVEGRKTIGFVPDLMDICQKYSLESYVNTYLTTQICPCKSEWKTL